MSLLLLEIEAVFTSIGFHADAHACRVGHNMAYNLNGWRGWSTREGNHQPARRLIYNLADRELESRVQYVA